MSVKKIPLRMCIGCREMKPKKELVRVVKTKIKPETEDGEVAYEVSLDLVGKKNGRGAYLCKNATCLKKARKSKRIDLALECKIPDEVYDRLEEDLSRE